MGRNCNPIGVPAGPVLSPLAALDHPHFKARNMVRWVDDKLLGSIPIPGFPWKFGAQPELPDIEAAILGQHNDEVLYQKARAGQIPEFTGISAPYEEPLEPELVLFPNRFKDDAPDKNRPDLWGAFYPAPLTALGAAPSSRDRAAKASRPSGLRSLTRSDYHVSYHQLSGVG